MEINSNPQLLMDGLLAEVARRSLRYSELIHHTPNTAGTLSTRLLLRSLSSSPTFHYGSLDHDQSSRGHTRIAKPSPIGVPNSELQQLELDLDMAPYTVGITMSEGPDHHLFALSTDYDKVVTLKICEEVAGLRRPKIGRWD